MMRPLTDRQHFAVALARAGMDILAICGDTARSIETIIDCPACTALMRITITVNSGEGSCILCRHRFKVTIGEVA